MIRDNLSTAKLSTGQGNLDSSRWQRAIEDTETLLQQATDEAKRRLLETSI